MKENKLPSLKTKFSETHNKPLKTQVFWELSRWSLSDLTCNVEARRFPSTSNHFDQDPVDWKHQWQKINYCTWKAKFQEQKFMDESINAKMTAQYTLCSAVNNRQRENHLSENASSVYLWLHPQGLWNIRSQSGPCAPQAQRGNSAQLVSHSGHGGRARAAAWLVLRTTPAQCQSSNAIN